MGEIPLSKREVYWRMLERYVGEKFIFLKVDGKM
jgi:hypothetical protein